MKNTKIIFGLLIVSILTTGNLFAAIEEGVIGAPLDGGLLTILAAAGVTYYLARKRKKASR